MSKCIVFLSRAFYKADIFYTGWWGAFLFYHHQFLNIKLALKERNLYKIPVSVLETCDCSAAWLRRGMIGLAWCPAWCPSVFLSFISTSPRWSLQTSLSSSFEVPPVPKPIYNLKIFSNSLNILSWAKWEPGNSTLGLLFIAFLSALLWKLLVTRRYNASQARLEQSSEHRVSN